MAGGGSGGASSSRRDQLKIDLAAEGVDAGDLDADAVAQAEGAAMAAAFDQVLLLIVVVGVVLERREPHQPVDEVDLKLHEETEARQAHDKAAELLADLIHHELRLLEIHHLALRLHGDALALGGVFPGLFQVKEEILLLLGPERFALQGVLKHPVDDQVGVAPDGRGKVSVAARGEAEVADIFGGVMGLFHGAQEDVV